MRIQEFFTAVTRKLARQFYDQRSVVVYAQDLTPDPVGVSRVFWHAAADTPDDVRHLMQRLHEWDPREIRRRASLEDACVVSRVNGRLAGFAWVTNAEMNIREVASVRLLAPGHCWIYHCHVSAPFRGHGVYPVMLRDIMGEMARRHYSVAWIGAEESNKASLHGIEKAGFTKVGDIVHRTRLGRTISHEASTERTDALALAFLQSAKIDRRAEDLGLAVTPTPDRRADLLPTHPGGV